MIPWNIIIAMREAGHPEGAALRARIERAWTNPRGLHLAIVSAEALRDRDPGHVDAVVRLGGGNDTPCDIIRDLDRYAESGIAVIAITEHVAAIAHDRNIVGLAPTVSDDLLVGILNGVLTRQDEVAHLQAELSLARRCHGGLEGEIGRMHEQLQLAAMVQREFLPRELPALGGISFATLWQPAHYVSGDIYDVARLDDDHIGFFIADAAGHGVPAALMTMVIARSLTTKLITGNEYRLLEPSEVLCRLNSDMVRRQGESSRFATAVYGLVNCRTRVLRLAGAGHPAPLLFRADGTHTSISTDGGLLGVFPDETFSQVEVQLETEDRLLLYSDGFEQAFPPPHADVYERRLPTLRYLDVFGELVEEPTPTRIIDRVRERLNRAYGSLHPIDDLTLMCLHAGEPNALPETTARTESLQSLH